MATLSSALCDAGAPTGALQVRGGGGAGRGGGRGRCAAGAARATHLHGRGPADSAAAGGPVCARPDFRVGLAAPSPPLPPTPATPLPFPAPSGDPSRLRRPSPPPAGTLPIHWGGPASVLLADPRTPPSSDPEADPLRGETAAGGPRVGQMPKNPAFSRPEPRLCGPGGEGSLGVLRTGGWPWAAGPRGGFTASCGSAATAADGSRPPGRACPLGDSNCPRRRLG